MMNGTQRYWTWGISKKAPRVASERKGQRCAGGQGTLAPLSITIEAPLDAAARAAAAAAKVPEPPPAAPRTKAKKVSWRGDDTLVLVRWFLQVVFHPLLQGVTPLLVKSIMKSVCFDKKADVNLVAALNVAYDIRACMYFSVIDEASFAFVGEEFCWIR